MVAVHDEDTHAVLREPGQAVPKAQLSPQAANLLVVYVSGDQEEVGLAGQTELDQVVEGGEGRLPETATDVLRVEAQTAKGSVEMEIRGVDEAKEGHGHVLYELSLLSLFLPAGGAFDHLLLPRWSLLTLGTVGLALT
jgi:hypothetical protein